MKTFIIALISFASGAILVAAFFHYHEKPLIVADHKEETPASETNQEGVVKLTLEKQNLIDLKIASPEAGAIAPEVLGFGRVIDPAALIASVSETEIAQAALSASQKEFERLNVLHQQNQNVSTRVLETAQAALKRDQLTATASRLKILSTWGRSILDRANLDQLIQALAEQTNALVRVDLALTDAIDFTPQKAFFSSIADEKPPVSATFISKLGSVEPQSQGQSYLFLLKQNPGEWPVGSAVRAHLQKEGAPLNGWIIPRSAVVRSQGIPWIYVQKEQVTFVRQQIDTDWPIANGWLVTNNLAATNKIVIQGAQTVLSQELSNGEGAVGLRD